VQGSGFHREEEAQFPTQIVETADVHSKQVKFQGIQNYLKWMKQKKTLHFQNSYNLNAFISRIISSIKNRWYNVLRTMILHVILELIHSVFNLFFVKE
jgi:hypothetical protein